MKMSWFGPWHKNRHNGCMKIPTGFVHQGELAHEINDAIEMLRKDEVVRVNYNIGTDSTDDASIFFRVVLTDPASREDRLADVTGRVASTLFDMVHPIEKWGLIPYFNFRSQSEQMKRNDPEWS
jgi:hypothetical protein